MSVLILESYLTVPTINSASYKGTTTLYPVQQSVGTDDGWPQLIVAKTVFLSYGTPFQGTAR